MTSFLRSATQLELSLVRNGSTSYLKMLLLFIAASPHIGVRCHVLQPIENRAIENTVGSCPPFSRGTFNIDAYQLYPENGDWDAELCQVYFG